MNAIQTLAVAKVIKDTALKTARHEVDPGIYPVDTLVHITGTIRIGEDEEYIPTTSIPVIDALALMLHDAGITGPNAINTLMRAMTRALNQDEDAKAIIKGLRSDMEEAEAKVTAALDTLPVQIRHGKVTTKLTITEIVAQENRRVA